MKKGSDVGHVANVILVKLVLDMVPDSHGMDVLVEVESEQKAT